MADVTKNKTVSYPEAYDKAVKEDTTLQSKYSHMCYKAGVFTFTFDSALSGSEDTALDDILTNTSDASSSNEIWREISYDSDWETSTSYSPLCYRCHRNVFQIEGIVKRSGSDITPSLDLIGTLETEFYPAESHVITGLAFNSSDEVIGTVLIKIESDGEVRVTSENEITTNDLISISAVIKL